MYYTLDEYELLLNSWLKGENIMCGHVKLFGATGDEKTDDTQAFQDAIDFCAENGPANHCPGEVLVPPGNYRIAGTLKGKGITLKRCNDDPKQEEAPDTLPEIDCNECTKCGAPIPCAYH